MLNETDPSGRKTTCQYARNSDRLVSVTHPDGSRECQSWDDRGRLITGRRRQRGAVHRL
ncbi:hypothetical protein AADJ18_00035 [Erwinia amylovora]|uniref:hypothetical protein n=1 Tax=Erwinia amylovora TaxID=552 RepID=UPI0037DD18C3